MKIDRKHKVRGIPRNLVMRLDIDGFPRSLGNWLGEIAEEKGLSKKETLIRILKDAKERHKTGEWFVDFE